MANAGPPVEFYLIFEITATRERLEFLENMNELEYAE